MKTIEQREYLLSRGWRQIVSGNPSLRWQDTKDMPVMSLSMAVATQRLRDNNTVVSAKETEIHIGKDESEEPKEETKRKRKRKFEDN